MNYKCTNDECNFEGDPDRLCPYCGWEIKQIGYTRVPPTEPGWYWIQNYKIGSLLHKTPTIVFVEIDGEEIEVHFIDAYWSMGAGDLDGEWSERIEPPG